MLIVAERINSSRKSVAQAIEDQNEGFIQNEAESSGSDESGMSAENQLTVEPTDLLTLKAIDLRPECVSTSLHAAPQLCAHFDAIK